MLGCDEYGDGIDTECKEMLQDLAAEYNFQILAMEVMPDHIHLLVDCKPQFYISDMIKIMKGNLARQMFLVHPELKKGNNKGKLTCDKFSVFNGLQ